MAFALIWQQLMSSAAYFNHGDGILYVHLCALACGSNGIYKESFHSEVKTQIKDPKHCSVSL
jgi:hypothetical protein